MDRVAQLRMFLEAAEENGWQSARSLVAVRVTVQHVPADIPEDWWPDPTYTCVEGLDFTFTRMDRVPICVHKVHSRPWVQGTEQRISYRRALELLTQPLAESTIH